MNPAYVGSGPCEAETGVAIGIVIPRCLPVLLGQDSSPKRFQLREEKKEEEPLCKSMILYMLGPRLKTARKKGHEQEMGVSVYKPKNQNFELKFPV